MFRSIAKTSAIAALLATSSYAAVAQAQTETAASALEEVVVTARRRAEVLQDVPLAVQAFTGEALGEKGITEIRDLEQSVPGLSIGPGTFRDSTPAAVIRGFVSGANQIESDPSIPFILNEVPLNTPQGQNNAFFDIQDVQVLKGPQGTLQGRNTVGGAILITTRKPDLDGYGAYVTAGIGNYDQRLVEGVVNLPVNDTLGFRLGIRHEKRDGTWININDGRDYDDKNGTSFRASALWKPTDAVENSTVFDYTRTDTHGSVIRFDAPGFNFNDPTNYPGNGQVLPCTLSAAACARHNLGLMLTPGFYQYLVNDAALQDSLGWGRFASFLTDQTSRIGRAPFEKIRNWGVSNTTTWDLSDTLSVKNIVGYRRLNFFYHSQIDGTSRGTRDIAAFGNASAGILENVYVVEFEQITEELQAQGSVLDDRVNWIGGLFLSRYEGTDGSDTVQFGGRVMNPSDIVAKSFALYGQVDVDLTEKLSVTGGFRYTWDHRKLVSHKFSALSRTDSTIGFMGSYGQNQVYPTVTAANFATICNYNRGATSTRTAYQGVDRTNCTATRTLRGSAPSYNITLQYEPSEDLMVYLAHRQGYRAGFLQARAINDEGLINKDETVRDLELGLKSDFRVGGMPVRFNAAGYYAWYSNIAVSVPKIDPLSGAPINVAENSGQAVLRGLEAALEVQPAQGLRLNATYGYTYGRFDSFPSQTVNDAIPAAQGGPLPLIFYSFKGLKFAFPRHTFTLGGSYTLPLADDLGDVVLSANYYRTSNRMGGTTIPFKEFPGGDLAAYGIVNARVDWRNIMGSHVDVSVWANNLTDKHYYDGAFNFEDAAGFRSAFPADPRTYGVTLTYRFGTEVR